MLHKLEVFTHMQAWMNGQIWNLGDKERTFYYYENGMLCDKFKSFLVIACSGSQWFKLDY